ncbi:serine/threonine protein kinase [bacterium]|nr:serine/threonine protein kinase [bacterium]
MDLPGKVPESINCHSCGSVISLIDQAPFNHIDCPQCGALSVVPLQFGNFLLLNALGVGGMGTVYKALDLSLNRHLALKILRTKMAAKPEFIENFSREARAAASVNHPNIAQVYSFGEHQGQYYLAMELLERGSLDDRISTLGKLPEKDVLEIGRQVASGLRAAHQRGLLHRDIKPGNILFSEDGVPKIVDFGLARAQASTAIASPQAPEQIWGTPYYIAPEKLRGQPEDARSDMYSLGASLFHTLAGRPPFDAATATEVATKHATQPAFSLKTYAPAVHDYTARVIGRMLSKNPAERYETYEALLHDLNEAVAIVKADESSRSVVSSTGERVPVATIVTTLLFVVVCGVVIWFVWRNRAVVFNETANLSPPGLGFGGGATNGTVAAEIVDFQENSAWTKAWDRAVVQLSQGNYQEALIDLQSTQQLLGPQRPTHRRWVFYVQGMILLAGDRPSEALAQFVKARNNLSPKAVPAEITTANAIDFLTYALTDDLPLSTLEGAISRMPSWAAALSRVSAAFKHLEQGELKAAAALFRQYRQMTTDPDLGWPFGLQEMAEKLALECDRAQELPARLANLEDQGKHGEGLALLEEELAGFSQSSIRDLFGSQRERFEAGLAEERQQAELVRQAAEQRRREQEERERQQAEEEARLLNTLDPETAPLARRYQFDQVIEKYRAFDQTLKTARGHALLQSKVALVQLLVDFKNQLTADFARQPFDGSRVRTRTGAALSGRIVRANDGEIIVATEYGELVTKWIELTPDELMKVAATYATVFAAAENAEAQANRYLLLAAFARQFGQDRAATGYASKATQLVPALKEKVTLLFEW